MMRKRVFIVMLSIITVCAPLYAQEIKDSVPLQPEEPNNSVPLNPQETKNPTREIQADVKLGPLLFLALIDLELALSYKIRHSEHFWYGVQMGTHLLANRVTKSNSNHNLYSVSGVIFRQTLYKYGYTSSMIGLGLVWLHYNENYEDCSEYSLIELWPTSCDDWEPPPDIWVDYLGLSIPVSLQIGIRINAIKVGLSLNGGLMLFRTPSIEWLTPIQLGASVGYLW
jgi:hypothetical protein